MTTCIPVWLMFNCIINAIPGKCNTIIGTILLKNYVQMSSIKIMNSQSVSFTMSGFGGGDLSGTCEATKEHQDLKVFVLLHRACIIDHMHAS